MTLSTAAGGTPNSNGQYTAVRSGAQSGMFGTVTGQMSAQIVDVANPPAPSSPMGTQVASFTSASSITWSGSQAEPLFAGIGIGMTSQTNRSYKIANTGGPNTGWKVKETYHVDYGAPFAAQLNPINVRMNTQLLTPNLNIQVRGSNQIDQATINGVVFNVDTNPATPAPPSVGGTLAPGSSFGSTIAYSVSTLGVHITRSTPLAAVPNANNNPWTGIDWGVTSTTNHLMNPFATPGTMQLETELSTGYSASFSTI